MGEANRTGGDGEPFLVVRSGGQRCAIPVAAARLVTRKVTPTRLPGSAPRLLGLAQVGGEPVAVVDLHALLDPIGAPGAARDLTVVVRRADGSVSLGLAVDEAFGVAAIGDRRAPDPGDPPWLVGRAAIDGRELVILDAERLIADPGGS
ncbi:MAG: chemotaxis protein CheW [Thermoanaerobaculales bacterium]|jgi:chemotaxis signal transduction protein|nr:chemotaxis protein CheW [Thermoanaerobaculales bacterium]